MRRAALSVALSAGTRTLGSTTIAASSSAAAVASSVAAMRPFRTAQPLSYNAPLVAHATLRIGRRCYHTSAVLRARPEDPQPANTSLKGYSEVDGYKGPEEEKKWEDEEEEEKVGQDPGYLPFPPPFHTINIMSFLLVMNLALYLIMNLSNNDDVRDFIVEHFTLSHENAWRVYPLLTHSFYQEHLLQLAIDSWLLFQFGNTMIGFLGPHRLMAFWAMAQVGGGLLHLGRQHVELYYGMDPLEVRGRCFGPNPFILGLVSVEGLIFRHLNFIQSPPVPFLVLTAGVMIIDVWRIFTTHPEEHGASTGGALVAYFFWLLPTRMMGLDRLTAAMR